MSSFKRSSKSSGRTHRERSQPESRRHLGMLEKKKDYRRRADDHQSKEKTLKQLRQKALTRNPDEFYFKMVNTSLKNGVHQCEENEAPIYTDEQLKLMTTQDMKYILAKRQVELKKIEKLRASLHLIDTEDVKPKTHVIFVDSKSDAKKLRQESLKESSDVEEHGYTRRSERLSHLPQIILGGSKAGSGNDETIKSSSAKQAYRQLNTRLKRLEQLTIVLQKMEVKRKLLSEQKSIDPKLARRLGKLGKPKLVTKESTDNAAVYKWPMKRQK